MNTTKMLKIGKVVISLLGVGVTLASTYINEKELNDKITEEVLKKLAEKEEAK